MTRPKPTSFFNHPLRFWRKGEIVTLHDVSPSQTLLDVLRAELRACDVKEGCAAGDCGACTVVVAQPDESGQLAYRAINSCIRPAQAVDGLAVWSAADLAGPDGELHPVQQALVDQHATQCGFCTPGFAMSLFAMYQQTHAKGRTATASDVHEAISGNLCRCTGYRPIVAAGAALDQYPKVSPPEADVLSSLVSIAPRDNAQADYALPTTLVELLQLRAQRPDAQLIAGATDAGLWITQGLRTFTDVIDLSRVAELRRVETYPHHIAIGAAVPLQDAFDALSQERAVIAPFARQFAGWPVRSAGTMGGNVANGSPIGDSMPLLIALGAQVVLMAWRDGRQVHRELPLESLYISYRKNVIQSDEVLAWIKVPRPTPTEWLRAYKVSKRLEDDISTVCLAVRIDTQAPHQPGIRIGVGGVAPVPARAPKTEAALADHRDDAAAWHAAGQCLMDEFAPLSDLRASADYRRTVLGNLLQRAYLERTGQALVRLEQFVPKGDA